MQHQLDSGETLDMRAVEKGFRAAALKEGDAVYRNFLNSLNEGPQACPYCKSIMCIIDYREKTIVSLMGSGTFKRAYYECPCCRKHYTPMDEVLGVEGTTFTPGVRLAVSKLAAAGPFEWSSGTLAEIAEIYVSTKEVQRISESAGERIEAKNKERIGAAMLPESPRSSICEYATTSTDRIGATIYLEWDGTGIPMMKRELDGRVGKQPDGGSKTREVKLGCIFTQTHFDDDGKPIRDKGSTSYFGAIENAESFGWRTFAEANRREVGNYDRKVVIGDGAKWVWGIANQHFPGAIHIVDYYHAKEHIHGLVRELYKNPDEQANVLNDWLKTLESGDIKVLVEKIQPNAGMSERQRERARVEAKYFSENAERMRYSEFKKMGLFVGSGVVEAGCKTVIGQRLKQSGMFWSLSGANAIIALRCSDWSFNEDFTDHFAPKRKLHATTVA